MEVSNYKHGAQSHRVRLVAGGSCLFCIPFYLSGLYTVEKVHDNANVEIETQRNCFTMRASCSRA